MYRRRRSQSGDALQDWYFTVQQTILAYQDPVTGLFPAFLLSDGSTTSDAWVRDNTYTVMCLWALSIAYKKQHEVKENTAKAVELEQAVVKHMRGLLFCMMQQVGKVEEFKATQSRSHCLHAKYNRHTGGLAVGDNEWGHLQIDATSLYLLTLAQMTASGLQIIYSLDEVAFIQNLVFYIETAYRIPDYGIWERGDKTNNGEPELNASSIGMAKAALEALDGLDLFGSRGGPSSVIHIMEDELQQCNAKLESLLPRESMSKEIDAALLSIIGFPAFAVQNADLILQVREEVLSKLLGNYGCKRFLRDGYQTIKEDPNRLYYHPAELKMFDNIECEWPLFFAFLVIEGIFTNNLLQVAKFGEMMDKCVLRDNNGLVHIPELYYVPADKVELEYQRPHSQERYWGTKWQSMWAQSLYILANLLRQDFVEVGELDPLNRRLAAQPKPDIIVQVALVCENRHLQNQLADRGIEVETISEAQISCHSPLSILSAKSLGEAYQRLGFNQKMALSGRQQQKMGVLSTSQVYVYEGNYYAFTPQIMDQEQYYLWLDNSLLVDLIRTAIAYLRSNWKKLGRPTMTLPIMKLMLGDPAHWDKNPMWKLIEKMKSGYVRGTRTIVGNLSDLLKTSCITKLTFLELDRAKDVLPLYSKTSSLRRFARLSSILEVSPQIPRKSDLPMDVKGALMRSRRGMFTKPAREQEVELAPAWAGTRLQVKRHLSASVTAMRAPSHSRKGSMHGVDVSDLTQALLASEDIQEQADILHHLCTSYGPQLLLQLGGGEMVTVESLLDEVYQKASAYRLWPLLRHTAGLLHKHVEDLAQAVSDILVRQKQLSVGLPNPAYSGGEIDIIHPMSGTELLETIERGCGNHFSAMAVSQEIIIYLAMFIRLEPHLFEDMWRLRVGMIMTIVVQELGRFLNRSLDEATDVLLNINPCGLKNLLYHLLSGKEFRIDQIEPDCGRGYYEAVPQVSIVTHSKRDISVQLKYDIGVMGTDVEEQHAIERVGVWRRRRRLDGALNRVPKEFCSQVWYILEKCEGIQIGQHFLPQNPTIQEMTAGEWKFALQVESVLNTLQDPEYRQLVVEALVLVALVVQHDKGQPLGQVLVADHLISDANRLFLADQCSSEGPSKDCCCKKEGLCHGPMGICIHFYDSAPSGRYGTMSYFSHALVEKLKHIPSTTTDCRVS